MAVVLFGILIKIWLREHPKRLTQEFANHLYRERYEDAAKMLISPNRFRSSDFAITALQGGVHGRLDPKAVIIYIGIFSGMMTRDAWQLFENILVEWK